MTKAIKRLFTIKHDLKQKDLELMHCKLVFEKFSKDLFNVTLSLELSGKANRLCEEKLCSSKIWDFNIS